MKQFYFYESYAKPICKLTNKEIGQVSKAICGYIFEDREPSEKTLPKAKALFYLLQEQLTEEKCKKKASPKRNVAHFLFPPVLRQVFTDYGRRGRRDFNQAML